MYKLSEAIGKTNHLRQRRGVLLLAAGKIGGGKGDGLGEDMGWIEKSGGSRKKNDNLFVNL